MGSEAGAASFGAPAHPPRSRGVRRGRGNPSPSSGRVAPAGPRVGFASSWTSRGDGGGKGSAHDRDRPTLRPPPRAQPAPARRALPLHLTCGDPDRRHHAGAAGARHLVCLPRHPAAQPLQRRLRRAGEFPDLVGRPELLERAGQHRPVDGRLRRPAIRVRLDPGAPPQSAVPRAKHRPGAGVPSLGGAGVPVGAELGLAVQPGGRPFAPLALRARPVLGS